MSAQVAKSPYATPNDQTFRCTATAAPLALWPIRKYIIISSQTTVTRTTVLIPNQLKGHDIHPDPLEISLLLDPSPGATLPPTHNASQTNELGHVRQDASCPYSGAVCCIGGPALVIYVSPTEEELFQKYSPEIQKRSLENRFERQQEFDNFVTKLKEYSKSDKPIWEVAAQDEKAQRKAKIAEQAKLVEEIRKKKEEMQKSGETPVTGGSL
ncbi:uncharacterized protein BP5553_01004 [Venustampulla echinocandica]|uniref:Cytochrome b mRNA-processing protein 4 n=1 Tax=Venustampulla echinocandica TaxID=2656787 RepID=A0A370TZS4_9HELO|nr:uncharacterized protein BP5553_01004 [Venustampulla echinocandica]RDL41025.1 hypothetical protein BP5553_01004 [Venustampulla echinocandica]